LGAKIFFSGESSTRAAFVLIPVSVSIPVEGLQVSGLQVLGRIRKFNPCTYNSN